MARALFEWHHTSKIQGHTRPPEDHPAPEEFDGVILASVVEGWATIDFDWYLTPYDPDVADQVVAWFTIILNGHEVQYLGDALGSAEAGKENIGTRQVELLTASVLCRTETEVATPLVIQDRSEDTGRVESGQAKPIYSPVRADQSSSVKITYDPVIFNREVAHVHSRSSGPVAWRAFCPTRP
jgi:hypothetical protein